MNEQQPGSPTKDLIEETRRIWEANATWWDDRIGDGNRYQVELIEPATERLIDVRPGVTVLDIGCGGGRLARRMAEQGARVVAFDFSERFIERAGQRTPAGMTNIEYHVIDATQAEQLATLGQNRFDAAVATMCLMDMATIEPLFSTLPGLLKPGGWLVFSVMHPCFDAPEAIRFAESVDTGGQTVVRNGVKIWRYLTPTTWKGVGIVGQPEPHYYFHRPLHALFRAGFENGFVIDGLEEPTFAPQPVQGRHLRRDAMPEIAHALVVRMRRGFVEPRRT